MLEIKLPPNYVSSLEQDNQILSDINDNLEELKRDIVSSNKLVCEEYIPDFESYTMSVYFSENTKKADISIFDDIISIVVGGNTVRINSDGIVIQ